MPEIGNVEFGFGFLTEDFPVHSDDYWEIHAIYSGSGRLSTPAGTIRLVPKILTVSPPEERHGLEVESPLVFHIARVRRTGEQEPLFRKTAILCAERGGLVMDDADHYRFLHWKSLASDSSEEARAAVWFGLVSFLNELAVGTQPSPPEGADDSITRVIRYMEQHVREKISLDDLAEQAGLTRFRLGHLFKERVGLSPIEFFLRMKMEAACHLLGESDRSGKEIAAWLGYSDEFYFSKLFKAKTGRTPRQYRRDAISGKTPLIVERTLGATLRGRHGN